MKLLKFYADWCAPCRQQSRLLDKVSGIEIISVDIEAAENWDLVEKFQIRSLPTLILLDSQEKEITRFVGLTTLKDIQEKLNNQKDG